MQEIRKAIDDADEILLRALATRFRAVAHMKELKRDAQMQIESSSRETELKALWKKRAKTYGVSEELALLILDFILSESKRVQGS